MPLRHRAGNPIQIEAAMDWTTAIGGAAAFSTTVSMSRN